MNTQRISLISGVSLVVIGLALAVNPALEYWRSKHVAHTATSPFSVVASTTPSFTPPQVAFQGEPVRIQIPSLKIDLNVIDGYYNKSSKTWTLTKDMAQYATVTPLPNNLEGNTFIYAHNRQGVFKDLSKIRVGDEAIITTDNNHTFTYKFRTSYETNPNDNSLFGYRGAPILTLQTCSGVWYQNRQLFTFDLVSAQ
jgi:LPXTG-site transpeptidase (sortase) family protein